MLGTPPPHHLDARACEPRLEVRPVLAHGAKALETHPVELKDGLRVALAIRGQLAQLGEELLTELVGAHPAIHGVLGDELAGAGARDDELGEAF